MDSITSQAFNSKLSKQGKTTTNGIFEGEPQNVLINERGYRVPGAVEKQETPLDISFNHRVFESDTYLQYLERRRLSKQV